MIVIFAEGTQVIREVAVKKIERTYFLESIEEILTGWRQRGYKVKPLPLVKCYLVSYKETAEGYSKLTYRNCIHNKKRKCYIETNVIKPLFKEKENLDKPFALVNLEVNKEYVVGVILTQYREELEEVFDIMFLNQYSLQWANSKHYFFPYENSFIDPKIRESHEILKAYPPREDSIVSDRINGRKIIIAIGGAKGGIGKSIFAANLGVFLASKGKRTVLVDLDLGGANLHLYLGETLLEKNINDFLSKRAATLEKIMVSTRYGPQLIGGDSSHLGAANIQFTKKLALLGSIKKIDADYVIIDLGGDTSYNIIDFFLAADQGIVMTTCDPASYLDAYSFIKVALYRKLNRLFGPESKLRTQKDRDLQRLIYEATMSSNGSNIKNIEELLQRVKKQQSQNLSLLSEAISSFNPYLILNRVTYNSNVTQVVERIQGVSRKMLSIKVGDLGSLAYQSEIESSAMDLVPIVARYPEGDLAKKMSVIIEKLLHG